jgi:hypothetical protein
VTSRSSRPLVLSSSRPLVLSSSRPLVLLVLLSSCPLVPLVLFFLESFCRIVVLSWCCPLAVSCSRGVVLLHSRPLTFSHSRPLAPPSPAVQQVFPIHCYFNSSSLSVGYCCLLVATVTTASVSLACFRHIITDPGDTFSHSGRDSENPCGLWLAVAVRESHGEFHSPLRVGATARSPCDSEIPTRLYDS